MKAAAKKRVRCVDAAEVTPRPQIAKKKEQRAPSKASVVLKPSTKKSDVGTESTVTSASTERLPCKNALLVVSTYHAVMAGLVYKKDKFYMKFSVKRHVGRVNGAAVTERYIASAGVDERVFLFTNKAEERLTAAARKKMRDAGEPLAVRLADLGSITPPTEVTALVFTDGSQHLLCGCASGQLLIYRCRDWSISATLAVHEKAVIALAVHPGSHGSLAVTVGDDRAVAVLDLVRGRLLTKWKYNPSPTPPADSAPEKLEDAEGPRRSLVAPHRETPVGVRFSPGGTRLAIFGRFSFVVYDAGVMQPICSFRCASPQPPEEMHSCVFFSETHLIVGTEAGVLKVCHIDGTPEAPVHRADALLTVTATYPEALQAEATALLATLVRADVETRQKNPLRHVNRIKALQVHGSTVFSVDSSGIVLAWGVDSEAAATPQPRLHLQYMASANCQGRVTDMELYPL